MIRIQLCGLFKITRRHFKKIIIVAAILGLSVIVINLIEFLRENNCEIKTTDDESQDEIWMDVMAARMEKRKKRLEETCKFYRLHVHGNDSLHQPNIKEFLINRPFRLIWCNVFKAASTSWMYNFNILAGYQAEFLKKTKEVPLKLARKKYKRPTLEDLKVALNDSTSFLIVRHPFDRLLSGYRDKIVHAYPNSFHDKLGNYIVKKYRNKGDKKLSFFDYFKTHQKRPSFSEFVQFLIDFYLAKKSMDMHWIPINNFCTPCQVRFDVIIKFETLHEDQSYLIKKKNLQSWIKSEWKNRGKGEKETSKHYSQLNATQFYQLYEMFMYDFRLFDYSIDDYLKYIKIDGDDLAVRKLILNNKRFKYVDVLDKRKDI